MKKNILRYTLFGFLALSLTTACTDDFESLNYFQKVLVNGGVIDALRENGCSDGDTVSIYDIEFDFTD